MITTLETHVVGLILIGLRIVIKETIVFVETTGEVIVELTIRTGDGEILVVAEGMILIQQVIPVGTFGIIDVASLRTNGTVGNHRAKVTRLVTTLILLQPSDRELLCLVDTRGIRLVKAIISIVEVLCPYITVRNHVRHVLRRLEVVAGCINHLWLPLLRTLRGNQDDTEWRTGTINSGSSGILQDGNALNIIRVQHRGITLHPIDQHQSATPVDRSSTTHVEVGRTSRFTIGQRDVQVRNDTLQHLGSICRRTTLEYITRHLLHSSGQIHLLLRTITYDNDLFEILCILFNRDLQRGTIIDGYLLLYITDVRN